MREVRKQENNSLSLLRVKSLDKRSFFSFLQFSKNWPFLKKTMPALSFEERGACTHRFSLVATFWSVILLYICKCVCVCLYMHIYALKCSYFLSQKFYLWEFTLKDNSGCRQRFICKNIHYIIVYNRKKLEAA